MRPAVLLVRPQQQAEQEAVRWREAGWRPLPFPTLELAVEEAALALLPEQAAQADVLFWVSPSAVELAAPFVDFTEGRAVHIAVGGATKKALQRFTDRVFSPSEGCDSEAVLRMDIWQALPSAARVLIVRGQGGRDFLADALRRQGCRVAFAEVYCRRHCRPDWHLLAQEQVQAVYVASGEAVRALFGGAPPELGQKLQSLLYFTHHERVAETLKQAGASRIRLIATSDSGRLRLLRRELNMSGQEQDKHEAQNNMPSAPSADDGKEAEQSRPQQAAEAAALPPVAAAPVVIKQSGGKGLAAGALVLALLALGASGFLFVQGQNVLKNQELSFSQKIDKAALGESQNAGLLQESIRKQDGLQTAFDRLDAAQKHNAEQIAQANRAYQELLKGRANWLVDEVEATLNLAAQQLLLSGNVLVAVNVLENIENRLNRFEQADLLPIKQAVSGDLTALKSRPYLDIAGTSLRIDRLESAVAGLPLTVDAALQHKSAPAAHQDNAALSWWENAWNKTLASLQGLVEVRTLNNGDAMLLSPEQIYFVRENLRLRLLDARAALMQHNGEVYQSDLDGAETTVKQYFDVNSPATQSWLKELADLKALDVRMVSNDALRNSLLAVRNYQDAVHQNRTIQAEAAASDSSGAQAASVPALPAEQPASAPVSEPKASEPSAPKGGQA